MSTHHHHFPLYSSTIIGLAKDTRQLLDFYKFSGSNYYLTLDSLVLSYTEKTTPSYSPLLKCSTNVIGVENNRYVKDEGSLPHFLTFETKLAEGQNCLINFTSRLYLINNICPYISFVIQPLFEEDPIIFDSNTPTVLSYSIYRK